MRQPLLLSALLLPLLAASCIHTYQKEIEPTKEQKIDLYTTTATYLYEDDELDRAQDQAVKALELDPENRAMRRMIGWIRLRKAGNEDLIIAERFFRDLLRDGDENQNTRLGLAIACERLGKAYDDVARALRAGEREAPKGRSPEQEISALQEKTQAYWSRSVELLEGLLVKGEGNTNAMNALQRVLALQGRLSDSLAWSERILERTTGELASWNRLLREKDLNRSEERLYRDNQRNALQLQVDTHLFAATLLFRLERYDEALTHLDQVVDADPELPQAYGMRGQMRARVGRYEEAIADIDRYLALSDAPYESPDVRKAFALRAEATEQLTHAASHPAATGDFR
jgi:tetratricopeptide (TPR) repeat protein